MSSERNHMLPLHRKKIGFQKIDPRNYPQYTYPREILDFKRALTLRDIKGEIREVITLLCV